MLYKVRRYISVTAAAIGGGMFWGMLDGGLAKWLTGMREDYALFLVGVPVAIVFIFLMWKKLPKILRFER